MLYGVFEFPCKNQKQEKRGKYVTTINIKVAILNTGLRISCVPLSPNAAETVLSVILP